MEIVKKKAQVIKKAEKILTPTQNRVFMMDKEILLGHYVLIMMKESRLSAEERRLVQNRVAYGTGKGIITKDDIHSAKNKMEQFFLKD